MQRAQPTGTTPIHFQSQATRVIPGHGTGNFAQALNDDDYHAEESPLRTALAIVVNVFGGSLLLAAMIALPYLVSMLRG